MFSDWESLRAQRGSGFWSVIGRLRPDVTFEQAQAEMNAIARRLDEQLPVSERNRGISVVPLSLHVTGARARLALWMLTGAVFFVLLIAATNVASLSLVRSASREREIAVRAALGASRVRIVRQLLAGSAERGQPRSAGARLGFGPLPPHRNPGCNRARDTMARRNLRPSGQGGGRGIAGGTGTRRIRRALVVTEFGLAIVLLIGAGLLVRSLWSVQNVDLGFRPERVLSVHFATPPFITPGQRANFYNRVLEQIESLPGVENAGITSELFIAGNPERVLTIEGDVRPTTERVRFRSDDFFKTLGTPLLRGRFFSAAEGPDSPGVAIINDTMARRLWPGRDPVGKRFLPGASGSWFTVVGVVGDMRRQRLARRAMNVEPIVALRQE